VTPTVGIRHIVTMMARAANVCMVLVGSLKFEVGLAGICRIQFRVWAETISLAILRQLQMFQVPRSPRFSGRGRQKARFVLCPALVANPLCETRGKRTMRDAEVQLGNPANPIRALLSRRLNRVGPRAGGRIEGGTQLAISD
jgi:hypothetical protein